MAFFRNDAVNRVNLHSAVKALAIAGGGVFFFVVLIRAGVPVWAALLAQAAIQAGRFVIRPAIFPIAKRWGLKPVVIAGALILALQYPLLAEVRGVGPGLALVCVAAALGEVFYWVAYNAYFAAVGDSEHRGHQVSAREALVAVASVVAPLVGAWALVTFGPRPMFAAVGLIQALSVLPLLGAPNVTVAAEAPGAFRAARPMAIVSGADGWFDAWYFFAWQILLFGTLGQSVSAYGGAMALAALAGAAGGLVLGRHIDGGGGRRAVLISCGAVAFVLLLRAASGGSPSLAVAGNALGAFAMTLYLPALGAFHYNVARASGCSLRALMVSESAWDIGCCTACLLAAGLAAAGAPLSLSLLLGLPALAVQAWVLDRYFASEGRTP